MSGKFSEATIRRAAAAIANERRRREGKGDGDMSRGPVELWSAAISLAAQVKAVEREIVMRERVYPGRVVARKMDPKKAGYEIACMRAVLETLEGLAGTPPGT